jgi:hypothetical protein
MRKLNIVESKRAFLLSLAMIVSIMSCSRQTNNHDGNSKEEPFSSIKTPIREVDSSVVYEPGDVICGRNAVVVRIVDASDKEFFFAILNDGQDGDYQTVLKNLPLSWDARYGVEAISDPVRTGSIPQAFFSKGRFDQFLEPKSAIRELETMLEKYIDSNSGRPRIALEQLKQK